MSDLSFTIPGPPVAKKRARINPLLRCPRCNRTTMSRQCKCGNREGFLYLASLPSTPTETVNFENLVKMCANEVKPDTFLVGPVAIEMAFFFPIPVSRAKKLREGDHHCQRPDVDNCIKSILDGCNGVIWGDDCVVTEIIARKRWGSPRSEVIVRQQ